MRRCPRGPRGKGRAPGGQARPGPSWPPRKAVGSLFRRKKANIRIEIVSKFQPNRSYGSPVIKETVKGQNPERRNRETDPISEGLSPLPRHGDHGPEGKPFSLLGRRPRKKKKGGSLPVASGGAGTPPGPSSSPRSTPTPPPSSPTSPSPSPLYLQWSTLPQPAGPST